jgi:hypothetical protein
VKHWALECGILEGSMPPRHVLQRKGNNIPQFCSFNMHVHNSEDARGATIV